MAPSFRSQSPRTHLFNTCLLQVPPAVLFEFRRKPRFVCVEMLKVTMHSFVKSNKLGR